MDQFGQRRLRCRGDAQRHGLRHEQPATVLPGGALAVRIRQKETNEEAAGPPDVSQRTARNYWAHARAWLYHEITVRSR